jgi:TetR/AcrR family transcriptional regulator, transcriptional repressor of bet genes
MARPSNTETRRRQIVEGLLTVMAAHGYDGASTQTIAEAAGLTAGLVHYHFANKQEILLVLIELLGERLVARYERRAKLAASPRARLYAFLDAFVALGSDASPDAMACWVIIGAEALRQKPVQAAYRRAVRARLDQLDDLVRAVLEDERRSTDGAVDVAAGLMAAIYGVYQLATAAHAAPKGFAAGTLRRMADGLLSAQVAL